MSHPTFYRIAVWMPFLLPLLVVIDMHVLGWRWSLNVFGQLVQFPLGMFLYGGPAYVPLALWASFWLRGKSRDEIHRMALRAPLLMVPAYVMLSLYLLIRSGDLVMPLAFFAFASVLAVPTGYFFVGATLGLERLLESVGVIRVGAAS